MTTKDLASIDKEIQKEAEKLAKLKAKLERHKFEHRIDTWKPNSENQRLFYESTKREIFLFGGNQSGKSEVGLTRRVKIALGQHPTVKVPVPNYSWIVSADYAHAKEVIFTKLIIGDPSKGEGPLIPPDRVKKIEREYNYTVIHFDNGSWIGLKSNESGFQKFQGRVIHGIMFDEQPDKLVYKECKERVTRNRGYLETCMTPAECLKHGGNIWMYGDVVQAYEREGKKRYPDIGIFYISKWDNVKYLGREEIEKAEREYDEQEKRVRIYGEWDLFLGRVYADWMDREPYVIPSHEVPEHATIYEYIDPHPRIPFAIGFIYINQDSDAFIFDEIWGEENWIVKDYARLLKIKEAQLRGVNGRNHSPLIRWIDPYSEMNERVAGKSIRREFAECGIATRKWSKDKDGRIKHVQSLLKLKSDGKPKLFTFDKNKRHRFEFKNYYWDEWRTTEDRDPKQQTRKKDDHFMDGMGGALHGGSCYVEPSQKQEVYEEQFADTGY